MQITNIQAPVLQKAQNKQGNKVSFSGNFARKLVGNGSLTKFADKIEFDGINMAFPVLSAVMIFGVITPRILQAQDEYDREEILRRDLISATVLTVGQTIINKNLSRISEAKSGFALASKSGFANKNNFQKALDYLNPVNGVQVLNGDQIVSKYSQIDKYKNGIKDFCDFVTENGGNLKKLFSFEKGNTKDIVERIVGKEVFETGDNKAIRDGLAEAAKNGSKDIAELYSKFASKDNPFVIKAKSLNSTFGFISMFLLVPSILGFLIPKVNEKITKKKFLEKQAAQQAKVAETTQQKISQIPLSVITQPKFNKISLSNTSNAK